MDYHIISIGDGAFLTQIFRFLSFLNSPGNNYFTHLGMVGGMLGLIMIIYTSIDNGQMPFGKMLMSIAAFTVFFGTPARVTIEDYYTGQTRVVSNVPYGSAAVGYIVSTLGIGITEAFQQAAAIPGVSDADGGNLPPNYAMNAFAGLNKLSSANLCTTGNALCSLQMSTMAYINDCYLPVLRAKDGTPYGEIRSAGDALAAMKNESTARATTYYPPDRTKPAQAMTCATAYTTLISAFASSSAQRAMCAALVSVGITRLANDGRAPAGESFTCDGKRGNPLDTAKEAIGRSGLDAQRMMQNTVVMNIYNRAVANKGYSTSTDTNEAILTMQAVAQHNVQSAADGSMWMRGIRSVMTFFEGFAYGIVPFLALMLPIPGIGMKLFGRMVAILLWISLWTPLASFVNLYQIMAVTGRLDALQGARPDVPIESMFGINQVQMAAADWVATSSAMMPMVVALSGFLLFGGIAAFSSVARGVGGGDYVDEKLLAPSIGNVGAVANVPPGAQMTHAGGLNVPDAPTLSYKYGDVASQSLSETQAAVENRMLQLTHGLTASASSDQNIRSSGTSTDEARTGTAASGGESSTAADKLSVDSGTSVTVNASTADNLKTGTSAKAEASLGVNFGVGGAKVSTGMSRSNDHVDTAGTVTGAQAGETSGAGTQTAAMDSMVVSVLRGHGDVNSIVKAAGMSEGQAEEYRNAMSQAQSEMTTLSQVASHGNSLGAEMSLTDRQIAQAVDQKGLGEQVQREAQAIDGAAYHANYATLSQTAGYSEMSAEERQNIAAVRTLHDAGLAGSNVSADDRVAAQAGFATAFGAASGLSAETAGRAFGAINSGMGGDVHSNLESNRTAGAESLSGPGHAPGAPLFSPGAEKSQLFGYDTVGAAHDAFSAKTAATGDTVVSQARVDSANSSLSALAAKAESQDLNWASLGKDSAVGAVQNMFSSSSTNEYSEAEVAMAREYQSARQYFHDPDLALFAAESRTEQGVEPALRDTILNRYGSVAAEAVSAQAAANSIVHTPQDAAAAAHAVNTIYAAKGSPEPTYVSPEQDAALSRVVTVASDTHEGMAKPRFDAGITR